ncbi:hypothetical protein ACIQXF_20475 [Lysinibacillus sp. NPDC097231]|uniref:hypothetical protein n=1 Tax=Lysinibacillus sp. NPDC097231 TaxID=3364142 RepID=UPI003816DF0D
MHAQRTPFRFRDIRQRFWPTDVFCAKAKRQRHEVGHPVVATGRGVLRLSSTISAGVWTSLKNRLSPNSSHLL